MPTRSVRFTGKIVVFFPTAMQIGASILRVLAFGWAVLQIGRLPEHGSLLQFVGYLPFFAVFDVLCQSWSRSAHIGRARWTTLIHAWRIPFVLGAMAVLAGTLLVASSLPDVPAAMLLITTSCVLGSLALVWERWLAVPRRAVGAAMIEILLLLFSVLSFWQGWLNQAALLLCFVGYLFARLLVLLVPGRAAMSDGLPRTQVGTRRYLGFSLGQQVMGAAAASMPSLYSTLTGSTAELAVTLALFRAMHSFAAIASFVINAIGGRLFFGEAPGEMALIERVAGLLRRWRPLIDGVCLVPIFSAATFGRPHILIILPAFVIMLAAINFRSSFAINRGRPKDCFLLQGSIFLASILAIFSFSGQSALIWFAAVVYAVYAVLSERYLAHPSDASLQTPASLNNR